MFQQQDNRGPSPYISQQMKNYATKKSVNFKGKFLSCNSKLKKAKIVEEKPSTFYGQDDTFKRRLNKTTGQKRGFKGKHRTAATIISATSANPFETIKVNDFLKQQTNINENQTNQNSIKTFGNKKNSFNI